MMLRICLFISVVIVPVVTNTDVSHVLDKKERVDGSSATDILNYAHLQSDLIPECTMQQYTTISTTAFIDQPSSNASDSVLLNHSMSHNHSHVILSRSFERLTPNVVHLTGTNTGLGAGLTKGVSKAEYYKKERFNTRKRVQPFFPLNHPRQNMSFCVDVSKFAELGPSSFYEHMKEDFTQPYVTLVRNALINSDGLVALECGWLQHRQSCCNRVLRTGRTWRAELSASIKSIYPYEASAWSSIATLRHALGSTLPVYDEVFVIDAAWDFNYYHFMVESLARLAPFYHYLQRNTHIKLHIRAHEATLNMSDPIKVKRAGDGLRIRARLFELLDIPLHRVINGTFLARKLYLPNDMECASPLKHTMELQRLANLLKQKANKVAQNRTCTSAWSQSESSTQQSAPVRLPASRTKIIIQARDCYNVTTKSGRGSNKDKWRCFTPQQQDLLVRTAEEVFQQSQVVVARASLTHPLACDIQLYSGADVVIGLHGAAMANMMFMRPGTVLVEIVGQFDPRMPPICGSFGPYSAVFGVHHFIYYYDGLIQGAVLDINDMYQKAFAFYAAIRTNTTYISYDLSPFEQLV